MSKPDAGFRIVMAKVADADRLAEFETQVWGQGGATRDQLLARIENSPQGNIMGELTDGRIAAYTAFCLLDYEDYKTRGRISWNDLSGMGTASTHVRGGPDLFGINLGAASYAPKGLSNVMLAEVVKSGFGSGVRRALLGARMPGYHRYANTMTAREYSLAERRTGMALDPELRYYYKFGMRPVQLVANYFKDPQSLDWGMLVEMPPPWWYNRKVAPLMAKLPLDWARLADRYM
jgi:hypothetical protein